ncbi:hypothetical protein FPQ18DRAFT_306078 [Pyronema domesticum]|nr:hypothetical protein FPQ18DRAFT_306078 [Pyronema domesticum]
MCAGSDHDSVGGVAWKPWPLSFQDPSAAVGEFRSVPLRRCDMARVMPTIFILAIGCLVVIRSRYIRSLQPQGAARLIRVVCGAEGCSHMVHEQPVNTDAVFAWAVIAESPVSPLKGRLAESPSRNWLYLT